MGLIFFVLFFLFALTYWLYKFMRALWKTDSMTEAYKLIMLDLNKGVPLPPPHMHTPWYPCRRCGEVFNIIAMALTILSAFRSRSLGVRLR
jgi:hypothetical protein